MKRRRPRGGGKLGNAGPEEGKHRREAPFFLKKGTLISFVFIGKVKEINTPFLGKNALRAYVHGNENENLPKQKLEHAKTKYKKWQPMGR